MPWGTQTAQPRPHEPRLTKGLSAGASREAEPVSGEPGWALSKSGLGASHHREALASL